LAVFQKLMRGMLSIVFQSAQLPITGASAIQRNFDRGYYKSAYQSSRARKLG
jgi:hypothetical protein